MVPPLSEAVRPAGRLLAVRLPYEPVPPLTATVPLKPGWLTVHAEDDSAPSVGAGLMVMLNVPVPVAPVASWTVMEALPKVPAVAGVPVKVTFVPVTVALRPGGRLDWAL